MALEIYIGDDQVLLSPETRIGFTFQINDIAELKDRQASLSNTFAAPYCDQNDRALQYSRVFSNDTDFPYKLSAVRVRDSFSGMNVIDNGIMFVEKTGKEYSLTIYSGIIDLFDKIGDKSLQDIYFNPANFPEYNISGLQAAYDNVQNSVPDNIFSYLVNDGLIASEYGPIEARHLKFAVYLKYLWDKIHSDAAFEYNRDSLLFSGEQFNKLFFTGPSKIAFINNALADTFYVYMRDSSKRFTNGLADTVAMQLDIAPTYINNGSFTFPDKININQSRSATISGDGTLYTTGFFNPDKIEAKIILIKNGDMANHIAEKTLDTFDSNGINGNAYLNNCSFSFSINPVSGDYYQVFYQITNNDINALTFSIDKFGQSTTGITTFLRLSYDETQQASDPYGQIWDTPNNLPSLKQKDVIKGVCQMYGLIPVVNGRLSNVKYVPFQDIVNNKSSARDFSAYVTEKKELIDTYFHPDTYGQINNFKYKHDEKVPDSTGNASININDLALAKEKDQFVLPWAASLSNLLYSGSNIYVGQVLSFGADQDNVILHSYDSGSSYTGPTYVIFENKIFRHVGANPTVGIDPDSDTALWKEVTVDLSPESRLLMKESINYAAAYFDETQSFTSPYIRTGFFTNPYTNESLSFNALIPQYYRGLSDSLRHYKKLVAKMLIPSYEINRLDQTIPVYLQQVNADFYLNKIINWYPGVECEVELIKI